MSSRIFISYRRVDAPAFARLLFDRLSAQFGEENIFMDVEHLDPGVDFVEAIDTAVGVCDALIVLIGKEWLTVVDKEGRRRLDNSHDFVRLEVATAIKRGVLVVPVLVEGASPPRRDELPGALQRLARLNAFTLRHERFNADAQRLIQSLEKYFEQQVQRKVRVEIETRLKARLEVLQKGVEGALEAEEIVTAQSHIDAIKALAADYPAAEEIYQTLQIKIKALQEVLRLASPQSEAEREVLEKAERERIAKEKAGKERRAREKAETDRQAKQKAKTLAETGQKQVEKPRWQQIPVWGWIGGVIVLFLLVYGLVGGFTPPPVPTLIPTTTHTAIKTTGSPTAPLEIVSTLINPIDGEVYSYIAVGVFSMGSDDGSSNESPVHRVFVGDFWISQTEVTNASYRRCVEADKCDPPEGDYYDDADYADHPVVYMDWFDAQSYCEWIGGRLPTEAEWEKAARGDLENKRYPWGDDEPVCELSVINGAQFDSCYGVTAAVGSFSPNGYGLYDMAGNAWEWVSSCYQEYPYNLWDGREDLASDCSRVLRGGSWRYGESNLRVAIRTYSIPQASGKTRGFRCVLSHSP